MEYLISSFSSLRQYVLLLFIYYKRSVLKRLPWLFIHIWVLGMTTQDKCKTVNSEYTVPNSKYDHSIYPHLLGYSN
jgi:hypothetical protein